MEIEISNTYSQKKVDFFSIFFLITRCLTVFCEQSILFFIPIYIYSITNKTSASGISFIIEWLPSLMVIPYAGILLDKNKIKVSYFFIDFSRGFIVLLLFLAIFLKLSWPFISICSSILAIMSALSFVCQEKVLSKKFSGNKFIKYQMFLQIFEQIGIVFGPLVGSFFIRKNEISFFLIGCALFFIINSIFIPFILKVSEFKDEISATKNKQKIINQLFFSISYIFKNKPLLFVVLITLCVNFTYGYVTVITPFRIITELSKTKSDVMVLASYAAFSSVFIILLSFILVKINKIFLGIFSFTLISLGAFLVCISKNYNTYIIGYCMIFSVLPIFSVFIRYFRNYFTDKTIFSQIVSAIVVLNRISFPIVGACVASISGVFNPKFLLIFCVILFIMFSFFAFKKIISSYEEQNKPT
jgi:MFS family permease